MPEKENNEKLTKQDVQNFIQDAIVKLKDNAPADEVSNLGEIFKRVDEGTMKLEAADEIVRNLLEKYL
jgi:hypothetical protein